MASRLQDRGEVVVETEEDVSDLGEQSGTDEESTSDGGSDAEKEIPFGERLLQQQSGAISRLQFAGGPTADASLVSRKRRAGGGAGANKKFKRENKNRPVEQSSKKPVPRLREVIEVRNSRPMDPRFDDMAGKYKDEVFKKRYSFIFDEQLPQEKSRLKKGMKSTKSAAKKQELHEDLVRIEQQIRSEKEQRRKREFEKNAKAKEKEAVKGGKKPFFLKKSEKKRQDLVQRYEDLKASGGLEKAMAKKRKKNASKDHRYVPSGRS